MVIKLIFEKIVAIFYPDIITYLANIKNNLDTKYKEMNEILIETYNKSHYDNFEKFLENLNTKRNIIYTFSEITENDFYNEKNIQTKFGIFNKQNTIINYAQFIKEENEVISIFKTFLDKDNKNMLIMKFSENELNKINSIDCLLNDFQKTNSESNEKIIIFIIYVNKLSKCVKARTDILDLISFINPEYYQIFIDNLKEAI